MRDIFSSEYWLLGKSCLDETDGGRVFCFVFVFFARSEVSQNSMHGQFKQLLSI